jgi:plastocyanin
MRQNIWRVIVGMAVAGVAVVTPASPARAGGGCHAPATSGYAATVDLKGACFTPTILRVEPGATVRFVNRDPMAHIVLGTNWGRYVELAEGDSVTERFETAGIYPYSCPLHPSMNGVVVVGDAGTAVPVTRQASSGGGLSWRSPLLAGAAALIGLVAGRSWRRRAMS